MKISKSHQSFANRGLLVNQRVLDNPEEFLGPNWKDVLNFWFYIDTLSFEQINEARRRFLALYEDDIISKQNLAWNAARDVMGGLTTFGVFTPSYLTTFGVFTPSYHVGYATRELIGSHKILEQGKPLTFVPLFLDL